MIKPDNGRKEVIKILWLILKLLVFGCAVGYLTTEIKKALSGQTLKAETEKRP